MSIYLVVIKMYCSEIYEDSAFGSYLFHQQTFLIHIFVERNPFVILYIRIQKLPNLHHHNKQIFNKTPSFDPFFFSLSSYLSLFLRISHRFFSKIKVLSFRSPHEGSVYKGPILSAKYNLGKV